MIFFNLPSLFMEGREFQHCFKIWVVLLHCVGGVVEHQAEEGVKLVWRGKAKSSTWPFEHRDTFELSTITVKRRREGDIEGTKEGMGKRWRVGQRRGKEERKWRESKGERRGEQE